MRRVCILVLGMHRSGTSLLTRIVSLLGGALPGNLMPPVKGNNEAGFWESATLKALHERMLAEAGSRWDDWRAFDPSALGPESLAEVREEIRRRIEEEYSDAPLIVLKDPRICRFVPLYDGLLRELNIEPRYLLIDRNPLAVISSLAARDGMTEIFAALLWLRHVLDAEGATRDRPRAFLSYEALLADWRGVIERVTRELGLTWPRDVEDAAAGIDAHLSRDFQHHRSTESELAEREEIPGSIKETYAALRTLAETDGGREEALATLDRVRDELERTAPVFGAAVFPEIDARLEALTQRTEDLTAEGARLRERERELKRDLHAARAEARGLEAKIDAIHASTSWRVTAPLRAVGRGLSTLSGRLRAAPIAVRSWLDRKLLTRLRLRGRRIEGRAPRPESGSEAAKGPVLVVGHASAAPVFGAERSLLDVVRILRRLGYEVHAVLPHDNPQYFEALLDHVRSLTVVRFPWWQAEQPVNQRVVNSFAELMRELRVRIVHVNTIMLREPLLAARRLGLKTVVHAREIITEDPQLCEYIGLEAPEIVAQVNELTDFLIGNSDAALRAFGDREGAFRVYNAVDINRLDIPQNATPPRIRVGMISSNVPKKGLGDFVRLALAAERELPEARFVLIGPVTRHVHELRELAGVSRLPRNLEVAGKAEDPRAAMEQVDVVVNLSSFAESFGRTVAEAMAARRPAIVYDHGALPELVRSGVDGFVVPYRQYDRALEPLRQLAAEPTRIVEMGERARARAVERFSLDAMGESLEAAYRVIATAARATEAEAGPLRVAYFLWHFPVPSETFVLNELRQLVARGVDVKVFCRHSPHRHFKPDFPVEWRCVASPEELAKALTATERTVVHSHFTYPTVTELVWPACERSGVPFTFIAHSQDIFRYENEGRNRIAEIARSPRCRKVLVPGRFHHAYLVERGVAPEKLMINPQFSDALELAEAPAARRVGARFDRRRICAVQRLVEKKGLKYLIDAAPGLAELGVSVSLYGYGPLEEELAEQIERVGADNVRLCGAVETREQLLEVFAEHDLLIAPSVRAADGDMDGMPTVLMEAMGTGLPVLSTRVSSVPDLIRDGVDGLLCEPADTAAIVAAVERFYRMPEGRVRAMTETAAQTVRTRYGPDRLMGNLLRLWRDDTVDVLIVSWNNLPQLEEVVERVFRYTMLPFRLIVCDNASGPDVVAYLDRLAEGHANVTVVHKGYNSLVGPGTNTAMRACRSRYAIYLCGKEGFAIGHGWESALVEYMDDHPEVGLAGTLGYSPSYLTGRQYVTNHPGFGKFRNRRFAHENSDRIFRHVQGGVFVIRRSMWEEIGGFSDALPHQHTDTEYSYYAESRGWRLGQVPEVLSLYNRTRPGLLSRLDENVRVVHPATLEMKELLDRVAAGTVALCNLCGWHGDRFDGEGGRETCPRCGSEPGQRTIHRYLAESLLTYRRLPGLYVDPHPSLATFWRQQFGDRLLSSEQLREDGGDGLRDGQLAIACVGSELAAEASAAGDLRRLRRLLAPDGTLLLWEAAGHDDGSTRELEQALQSDGLQIERRVRYASQVVRFDWRRLLVLRRAEARQQGRARAEAAL